MNVPDVGVNRRSSIADQAEERPTARKQGGASLGVDGSRRLPPAIHHSVDSGESFASVTRTAYSGTGPLVSSVFELFIVAQMGGSIQHLVTETAEIVKARVSHCLSDAYAGLLE